MRHPADPRASQSQLTTSVLFLSEISRVLPAACFTCCGAKTQHTKRSHQVSAVQKRLRECFVGFPHFHVLHPKVPFVRGENRVASKDATSIDFQVHERKAGAKTVISSHFRTLACVILFVLCFSCAQNFGFFPLGVTSCNIRRSYTWAWSQHHRFSAGFSPSSENGVSCQGGYTVRMKGTQRRSKDQGIFLGFWSRVQWCMCC